MAVQTQIWVIKLILCKNKREQSLSVYFVHAYKNMGLF